MVNDWIDDYSIRFSPPCIEVWEKRLTLGKRLKHIMIEKDINTVDLANMTGLTRVTISNIRNDKGERLPYKSTITKISRALGVTESWLLGETRQENKDE